jgi:hypothetical protein
MSVQVFVDNEAGWQTRHFVCEYEQETGQLLRIITLPITRLSEAALLAGQHARGARLPLRSGTHGETLHSNSAPPAFHSGSLSMIGIREETSEQGTMYQVCGYARTALSSPWEIDTVVTGWIWDRDDAVGEARRAVTAYQRPLDPMLDDRTRPSEMLPTPRASGRYVGVCFLDEGTTWYQVCLYDSVRLHGGTMIWHIHSVVTTSERYGWPDAKTIARAVSTERGHPIQFDTVIEAPDPSRNRTTVPEEARAAPAPEIVFSAKRGKRKLLATQRSGPALPQP